MSCQIMAAVPNVQFHVLLQGNFGPRMANSLTTDFFKAMSLPDNWEAAIESLVFSKPLSRPCIIGAAISCVRGIIINGEATHTAEVLYAGPEMYQVSIKNPKFFSIKSHLLSSVTMRLYEFRTDKRMSMLPLSPGTYVYATLCFRSFNSLTNPVTEMKLVRENIAPAVPVLERQNAVVTSPEHLDNLACQKLSSLLSSHANSNAESSNRKPRSLVQHSPQQNTKRVKRPPTPVPWSHSYFPNLALTPPLTPTPEDSNKKPVWPNSK